MKVKAAPIILAAIFFLTVLTSVSRSATEEPQLQWGQTRDGVQLSLSSINGDSTALLLALRNVGDRDVTLNLGFMLGNGKVQLPDYVSLNLTDAQGKALRFRFADKKHSFVAGRLDDYLVPLRAGSMYTLKVMLDQFWCEETNDFEIKFGPGKNLLTAQFEGRGAQHINLDMQAIKFMNFWLGKVESNTLVIERGP